MNRAQSTLALFVLLLGFAVPYLYQNADRIVRDCVEDGEYASNALRIEKAKDFEQLLGPYSHYNFHHLGPLLFYYHAAGEKLLKTFKLSPYSVHNIAQAMFNLSAVMLMLLLLNYHSKSLLTPLIFFVFLWAIVQKKDPALWFDTRGPYVVLYSMGLFIVSCAAVMRGRSWPLFSVLLFGSVILQTQISTISVVPVLTLVSFVWYARKSGTLRWKYILWLSCVFVLVLWLPPLIELVSSEQNNWHMINASFWRQTDSPPIRVALEFFYTFYVPAVVKNKLMWFLGLFLILWAIPFRTLKFYSHVRTLLTLSVFCSIIAVYLGPAELHPNIFYFHYSCSALTYGLLFVLPFERLITHRMTELFLYLIILVFITISTAMYSRSDYNPQCSQLTLSVLDGIELNKDTLYRIDIDTSGDSESWSRAIGIALELRRRDMHFCVRGEWTLLFGTEHSCVNVRALKKAKNLKMQTILIRSRDHVSGVSLIAASE